MVVGQGCSLISSTRLFFNAIICKIY